MGKKLDKSPNHLNRWFTRTAAAALGAAAFYLFGEDGLGWGWDGFFLVSLGMLVGQASALALARYLSGPKGSTSEGPLVLGNTAGIGITVALWLCLPEAAVASVGHIARAVLGAAAGGLLVMVLEPYDVVTQTKARG
jgi:hypothetical protein